LAAFEVITEEKEDSAKFHNCTAKHAAEMNATPQGFIAAFDRCMREAYGLQ